MRQPGCDGPLVLPVRRVVGHGPDVGPAALGQADQQSCRILARALHDRGRNVRREGSLDRPGQQRLQPIGVENAVAARQLLEVRELDAVSRGIGLEIDPNGYADATSDGYRQESAARLHQALVQLESVYRQLAAATDTGTFGPRELWAHHFDFATLWFSGRLVPGQDPADLENASEQMNFGFSAGDDSISDAYFYITAYPLPAGLTDTELPDAAFWHSEGFTAAVLPYAALVGRPQPDQLLLQFLRQVQRAGAERMR